MPPMHRLARLVALVLTTSPALSASPTATRFDGGSDDVATSLAIDVRGNRYLGVESDNTEHRAEFAVVKYDANGALQWLARYSNVEHATAAGGVRDIAVDAAGNVYAVGFVYTPVTLFTVNLDWLVVSYSPDGVERWSRRINGNADVWDSAANVVVDAAGNVYVSGSINDTSSSLQPSWTIIKYSNAGAVQWRRTDVRDDGTYDGFADLHLGRDGNIVGVGHAFQQTGVQHKIVATKISPSGQVLWRSLFSDAPGSDDFFADSALDSDGSVYITGETTPTTSPEDAHVPITLKYDADGARRFLLRGDGAGGASLALDASGAVVVSGTSFRESGIEGVAATARYDRTGNREWLTTGPSGRVAVDSLGNAYIVSAAGLFASADVQTTKLNTDGSIAWSHRYDATQLSANPSEDSVAAIGLDPLDALLVTLNTRTNSARDIVTLRYAADSIPQPPPASINAPTGLSARAAGRTVQLQWTDTSQNETAFSLERCATAACTNFVQTGTVSAGTTSFTDTTVATRTTYRYRVRAFAGTVSSAYSNIASVTTPKK